MTAIFTALSGIAGIAAGLTLPAIAGAVYAITVLRRLQLDSLTLQAANRFEAANLAPVLKNHLPAEFQSAEPRVEIAPAQQAVGRKIARWRLIAITLGAAAFGGVVAATLFASRNIQGVAVAPPPVDALKAIAGVWGWKYNALQSCLENPLTMTLTADGGKLSARFAKPVWDGKKQAAEFEYDVTVSQPNTLVLSLSGANTLLNDETAPPPIWSVVFKNADTYTMRRSDMLLYTTGEIDRCR